MFAAPWRSFTITPLDTCGVIRLDGTRYAAIRNSKDTLIRTVMENYRIWASNVGVTLDEVNKRTSILYDTVAVYLAFSTRYLSMKNMNVRVTDDGFTVQDEHARPAQVALDWIDLPAYYDFLTACLLR